METSLFRVCKAVSIAKRSGVYQVGGHEVSIEYYNQLSIDKKVTFGDTNQNKVVLVADDTITIPASYTLAPSSAKKSLVILCNTFVNNGIVSMTAKGPNILPHDYLILSKDDDFNEEVLIPAYANNGKSFNYGKTAQNGANGNNGTNRQCGSGGGPSQIKNGGLGSTPSVSGKTGSGSAFAGGGGCGGSNGGSAQVFNANTTYPMRGVAGNSTGTDFGGGPGGVGNPAGSNKNGNAYDSAKYKAAQSTGVGGRVIIFCSSFTNNGSIVANGVNATIKATRGDSRVQANSGGASGGGAVDIFFHTMITEGTITANGGLGVNGLGKTPKKSGNGGNGSVTLSEWGKDQVIRNVYNVLASDDSIVYLFNQYSQRLLV